MSESQASGTGTAESPPSAAAPEAAPTSGAAAGSVVGRASVPGDPSLVERTAGGTPKYTRAPGMAPPPDSLTVPVQTPGTPVPPLGGISVSPSGAPVSGAATGTASVPVGNASARASVRTGTIGGRGNSTGTANVTGSARVTEAVKAARATVTAAAGRGPRRARLHVKRIDPWSVMKFSFAVSFVLFVVVIIATSVLYLALDVMGVFESVNKALSDLITSTGGEGDAGFSITAKGVIGGSALLGLVNVVLFTALATLGAFIYNVCADLVGGVEITLAEKD